MISRRHFVAAAAVSVTGLVGWRFVHGSEEDAIIAVLRKRLPYLKIDDTGVRAYAKDLAAQKIVVSTRLRMLDVAGPLYSRFAVADYKNSLARELRHGEERIVSLYLLSSDFFVNGCDVGQTVHYLNYYDPIRHPRACTNPFSRPMGA